MKKSLFSTLVVALLAAVIVASSTITVQAQERHSADEKADSQAAKDHTEQADNACQKAGYDGYINDNCGYLN